MTKLLQIKKLILFLLLLPAFGFCQSLDHVQGELLIHTSNSFSPQEFTNSIHVHHPKGLIFNNISIVSKPLGVWKVSFDHNRINELDLLAEIRNLPTVANAQFNYFTENRTEPNDPYFSGLWYLKNIGQTDGTPGVDLDATLAWDQTTGGVSYTGDTVVICIIDERFDYAHEDLYDNIWFNHGEIPDNGEDDDGNGFIDDYLGWNASDSNDDIGNMGTADWHGTAVTGIAGARGNNNKGVSSLNWNIKLMLVSRGSTTADAIAAYTYPFTNRKLYNQTSGQKGVFVVATNSSWGVDFGTPDQAPIWCAMYDSLGSVGVLNSAATTNNNVDVDVVGDLPSTCLSEFLITVTSVDDNDVKTSNAGYGALSVDLGAFGKNILTTKNGNLYSPINGTSAAAPQVASTIGLLHTAPCPSFANFAKNNPQQSALLLKSYLLDGVEPNQSLEGITVTGGRLNTNNSLELLMDDCDFSGCFAPYLIEISNINASSATIEWLNDIGTTNDFVNLRYRQVNSSGWIFLNDVQSPMQLNGLAACTFYEFQLQSVCDNTSSSFTTSFTFKTDGCCVAPNIINFEASYNSIQLDWNEVTAAIAYNLRYREAGTTIWQEYSIATNNYTILDLIECQDYEIQINTVCSNAQSFYSPVYLCSTLGCGACLDFDYCPSSGPIESISWISEVSIADLNHYSGTSASGYSDFTDQSANLIQGFIHQIVIKTDFGFFPFPAFFSVWIDLNQDGIFDTDELLHETITAEEETTAILFIPPNTMVGSTRMRVAFMGEFIGPCGDFEIVGEVEDYCVFISEPTECLPPVNFNAETTENNAHLTWSGNVLSNEFMLHYREIGTNNWIEESTTENNFTLLNLSPCTDYEFFLSSVCAGETSPPSPIHQFTTKGCGACLDQPYCETTPCNTDFEWIERVVFNDMDNYSGPNDGYMHFPDFSTDLVPGENYSVTLESGFSNDYFNERFYIWIDFNQDGYFDESENVLTELSQNGESINEMISIPQNALTGSTRMRVSMKYLDPVSDACESGFFGEIEEYCVNIYEASDIGCMAPEAIYFQPVDSFSVFLNWESVGNAIAYKMRYRPSDNLTIPWKYITTGNTFVQINDLDPCIDYLAQVQTICDLGISDFSDTLNFNSCFLVSSTTEENANSITVYPNPFSQSTTLVYEMPSEEVLRIEVYSSLGHLVSLFNYGYTSGQSAFNIDLKNKATGIYFLKIYSNDKPVAVKKIILAM